MNKLVKLLAQATRLSVISMIVVALFAAGATSARRAFTNEQCQAEKKTEVQSESATLTNAPASVDQSGGMAKGSRPTTEQVFVLQAVTMPVGNDDRAPRQNQGSGAFSELTASVRTHGPVHERETLAALPQAAPALAQSFTLLGAVPSGTM